MTDSRYRLTKQEETHLDGSNVNNAEVHVMSSGKRMRKKNCNTSVLAFLTVILLLACVVLIALLTIEKMRKNNSDMTENGTLPCTSAQCVLASSSKLKVLIFKSILWFRLLNEHYGF